MAPKKTASKNAEEIEALKTQMSGLESSLKFLVEKAQAEEAEKGGNEEEKEALRLVCATCMQRSRARAWMLRCMLWMGST